MSVLTLTDSSRRSLEVGWKQIDWCFMEWWETRYEQMIDTQNTVMNLACDMHYQTAIHCCMLAPYDGNVNERGLISVSNITGHSTARQEERRVSLVHCIQTSRHLEHQSSTRATSTARFTEENWGVQSCCRTQDIFQSAWPKPWLHLQIHATWNSWHSSANESGVHSSSAN